ncbi:hypothetical protein [Methylopila sp. M107]|uniref:hypothetical protein n=1 Tax=Methylopila sp. M107 TaxID=1101190 RepID=UPI0003756F2C|nr:hypothetical protein [Methylopila sp. M107]
MRLPAGALLAAILGAFGAHAGEFRPWPSFYEGPADHDLTTIEHDPWVGGGAAAPFHDDAYVFADVATGVALSADAVAAAVRFDVERLAAGGSLPALGRARSEAARVAFAFDRFVQFDQGGRAYASSDVAKGRGGPASLGGAAALEPPILAMTAPER